VTRLGWLTLPALLAACASFDPPPNFLRSESKSWNDWLDTPVTANIANVPLGSLSAHAPFEGLTVVCNGVDPEYRVALQVEKVTRREALWKLANQYGLALTFGPASPSATPVVVISNSESRRENRPLN
jgi:hypothetical protein